jgi:CheY-like chemotaxis protein
LQHTRLDTWLAEFVETTKEIMRPNVRIELSGPRAPVSVEVDPAQLHQALVNLATNANDAMPRGGLITIELHQHSTAPLPGMPASDKPHVEVVFRDTGQGIPREVLDHIFEPLFTTKRGGGTGLGLAVVHQVVAGHKGHVSVETRVGEGTAFHLFLPQGTRLAEPKIEEPAPVIHATEVEGMRVLLVEDDATVAMALTKLLESSGARVEHVSEGAAVPSVLERSEFDLVVLDVSLGDIDGVEVYRRLRAHHAELPVLFSTGHAMEATVVSIGPDPHTGWLLKPYDTAEFLKAVRLVTGPAASEAVATLH